MWQVGKNLGKHGGIKKFAFCKFTVFSLSWREILLVSNSCRKTGLPLLSLSVRMGIVNCSEIDGTWNFSFMGTQYKIKT